MNPESTFEQPAPPPEFATTDGLAGFAPFQPGASNEGSTMAAYTPEGQAMPPGFLTPEFHDSAMPAPGATDATIPQGDVGVAPVQEMQLTPEQAAQHQQLEAAMTDLVSTVKNAYDGQIPPEQRQPVSVEQLGGLIDTLAAASTQVGAADALASTGQNFSAAPGAPLSPPMAAPAEQQVAMPDMQGATALPPEAGPEMAAPMAEVPAGDVMGPAPDAMAPAPEAMGPAPEAMAPSPEMAAPVAEMPAPMPEVAAPAIDEPVAFSDSTTAAVDPNAAPIVDPAASAPVIDPAAQGAVDPNMMQFADGTVAQPAAGGEAALMDPASPEAAAMNQSMDPMQQIEATKQGMLQLLQSVQSRPDKTMTEQDLTQFAMLMSNLVQIAHQYGYSQILAQAMPQNPIPATV